LERTHTSVDRWFHWSVHVCSSMIFDCRDTNIGSAIDEGRPEVSQWLKLIPESSAYRALEWCHVHAWWQSRLAMSNFCQTNQLFIMLRNTVLLFTAHPWQIFYLALEAPFRDIDTECMQGTWATLCQLEILTPGRIFVRELGWKFTFQTCSCSESRISKFMSSDTVPVLLVIIFGLQTQCLDELKFDLSLYGFDQTQYSCA